MGLPGRAEALPRRSCDHPLTAAEAAGEESASPERAGSPPPAWTRPAWSRGWHTWLSPPGWLPWAQSG